jgi:hypothetical protein
MVENQGVNIILAIVGGKIGAFLKKIQIYDPLLPKRQHFESKYILNF